MKIENCQNKEEWEKRQNKQKEILNAYFNKKNGLGYTLCRTHINSCDFSSKSYTYVPKGDKELKHFSISPDKEFRVPFIKEAIRVSKEKIKLLVSPWSPPKWMKSNNSMLQGGSLLPNYHQVWANYYIKFIKAYEGQGIPIWGLSIQNEPNARQRWESCIYSPEEERDFIKDYLGPTLWKQGLSKIKIIAWDHNRDKMFERAKILFENPEVAKYIWGIGFHWYDKDCFENVRKVSENYPDKKTLLTEACCENYDLKKINKWKYGNTYATSIINDLNNGAVGWIDWNLLVNEKGGPNHVGNYCFAPIIGHTNKDELTYMNSYYYIGHFSKFIRPGAKRVHINKKPKKIMLTAFLNKDGKLAIVILNKYNTNEKTKILINNKTLSLDVKKQSISTILVNFS